jgi:hypothetical protein
MSNSIHVKTTKPKHVTEEIRTHQCVCGAKVDLNVSAQRKLEWNCENCFREWTMSPAPKLTLVR